ncbi:MAG: glycoside hydrolase [Oscillospiraceae bacterium]|nr:glycoside hydrolase [Oscillospiraceae bacterium]
MEKILPGVYKLTLGTPERVTPCAYQEYPPLPVGADTELPFAESDVTFEVTKRGCLVSLPLRVKNAEGVTSLGEVYGLGLQLKQFRLTGKKVTVRPNADPTGPNGDSHAPVPFCVTTGGIGYYIDTARHAAFYCGRSAKLGEGPKTSRYDSGAELLPADSPEALYQQRAGKRLYVDIPTAQGVDIYIICGQSMLEAVQKYNMFSGGGCLPPEWGLGVWYRSHTHFGPSDWVELAERIRKQEMPISVFGLEPGWQTRAYPCSYVHKFGQASLDAIAHIKSLGYRVNAWEHCFTHPESPIYEEMRPYYGDYEGMEGAVPDFTIRECRDIFVRLNRTLGFDGFKLDECDGSDNTGGWSFPDFAQFPGGADGEQMHALFGWLYAQVMNEACPGSYHSVRNMYALAAPYPFVLYSDLYAHSDFIRGVCSASFCGLLWTPEVRDASSVKDLIRRMQSVVFSPQALINAWYIKNPPWEQINSSLNNENIPMEEAEDAARICRALFQTREQLIPYLTEAFAKYKADGTPPFRALVLDFPDDAECYNNDTEWLIGGKYLFAPLTAAADTREVYLPALPDGAVWARDGKAYPGGKAYEFTCTLEEYLLFAR